MEKVTDINFKSDNLQLKLDEALKLVDNKNSKIVWLGEEPISEVKDKIGLSNEHICALSPEEAIYFDREDAKKLENCIFMCYSGTTSNFLSTYFYNKYGVSTYILKEGLNSIVTQKNSKPIR